MKDNKALIIMDYINELTHSKGKLKDRGYVDYIEKNNIFENINSAIKTAREKNMLIIFVKIGFSKNYIEQPKHSPLFGKAKNIEAFKLNTWATEFNEKMHVYADDIIVVKHRISPFYNTDLETYLSANKIDTIYFAGVATDLVVQSAVRDAHDRDYFVHVLEDCCTTRSKVDQDTSIEILSKISHIIKHNNI